MTKPVWVLALCVAGVAASPVAAQKSDPVRAEVERCRALADDGPRLSCYDAALDSADEITEQVQMVEREDQFGMRNSNGGLPEFVLEATIVQRDQNLNYGTLVVALDNGQVWQVLDRGNLRARFQPGEVVKISETSLGGFRLRMDDRQGYRSVKRLR